MRKPPKLKTRRVSAGHFPLSVLALCLSLAGCRTPGPTSGDFAAAAKRNPAQTAFVRGVPPFTRHGAESPAEPLSSVLQFWKRPASAVAIREWFDAGAGTAFTPEDRPARYAWQAGLWACALRADMDQLRLRLRSGIPVIVLLQDTGSDLPKWRYAIAVGWNDETRTVLCHDGERRERAFSYSEFQQAWSTYRNWMLEICPPEFPAWELDSAEHAGRGQFYETREQFDKAAADYEAAIASGLASSALHVRLGNAYRSLGRIDEAEAAYRRALALNPRDGRACNNLAYVLAEKSTHLDEAVKLGRQAILLEPTNPLALDTLGFALLQSGNYKEASDVLERARARSRWFPVETQVEIGMHLVWAHYRNGQNHLAREVLKDMLSFDPGMKVPPELAPLLQPAGRAP